MPGRAGGPAAARGSKRLTSSPRLQGYENNGFPPTPAAWHVADLYPSIHPSNQTLLVEYLPCAKLCAHRAVSKTDKKSFLPWADILTRETEIMNTINKNTMQYIRRQ